MYQQFLSLNVTEKNTQFSTDLEKSKIESKNEITLTFELIHLRIEKW